MPIMRFAICALKTQKGEVQFTMSKHAMEHLRRARETSTQHGKQNNNIHFHFHFSLFFFCESKVLKSNIQNREAAAAEKQRIPRKRKKILLVKIETQARKIERHKQYHYRNKNK